MSFVMASRSITLVIFQFIFDKIENRHAIVVIDVVPSLKNFENRIIRGVQMITVDETSSHSLPLMEINWIPLISSCDELIIKQSGCNKDSIDCNFRVMIERLFILWNKDGTTMFVKKLNLHSPLVISNLVLSFDISNCRCEDCSTAISLNELPHVELGEIWEESTGVVQVISEAEHVI